MATQQVLKEADIESISRELVRAIRLAGCMEQVNVLPEQVRVIDESIGSFSIATVQGVIQVVVIALKPRKAASARTTQRRFDVQLGTTRITVEAPSDSFKPKAALAAWRGATALADTQREVETAMRDRHSVAAELLKFYENESKGHLSVNGDGTLIYDDAAGMHIEVVPAHPRARHVLNAAVDLKVAS